MDSIKILFTALAFILAPPLMAQDISELTGVCAVSYTHLTLPTNREV